MTLWSRLAVCPPATVMKFPEKFDPRLSRITSVDQAEALIRAGLSPQATQGEVTTAIDAFVRDRFYHELSENRLCDANWISVLASGLWEQLKYPVHADQILSHASAWCSQQTRVFQALAERFGITYATVRIEPIHMIPAAKVDGRWLAFDPDVEMRLGGAPFAGIADGSGLDHAYPNRRLAVYGAFEKHYHEAAKRGDISLSQINENPAARGGAAELMLLFLSVWGWVVFALLWLAHGAWARSRGSKTGQPVVGAPGFRNEPE